MSWSEARTSRHVTGWDAGAAGVGLPGLPQLRACGPGLHIGECREVHLVAQEAHARGYVRVAQQLGVTQGPCHRTVLEERAASEGQRYSRPWNSSHWRHGTRLAWSFWSA